MHDTLYESSPDFEEHKHKEAFTGVKPEIEHFRIFGCPMYFSCTQREEVQARPFKEKGYIYRVTVNLRRHSRSTFLVRDRLR
jgi:hypothetical protein